jgi:hypothetical protein
MAYGSLVQSERDHRISTEPQVHANNLKIYWPRGWFHYTLHIHATVVAYLFLWSGKMLGGCKNQANCIYSKNSSKIFSLKGSAMNAMMYEFWRI